VQRFFDVVHLQRILCLLQLRQTYAVACTETVEYGNAKIESQIPVQVIFQLRTKATAAKTIHCIKTCTQSGAERKLRIISALRNAYALFASFQPVLRRKNSRLG
ncbi:hypothetical protein EZS27_010771, partial [termite gut metagenome]